MKYFLLAASAAVSFNSLAQQADNQLDPVTVTATVSPAQTSKTGRNILVIKGDQFAKTPVNSIDELLRYVPGIEVQARGAMGSQSDIIMRGGTFQQVLVILDGIRLNDPLTGHFNSYIPIAPGEIDRIEVLKGASSAIYGTEAVGGVIHIITKSFAQSVKKNSVAAQVAAGSYGMLNAQASASYADSKNTFTGGLLSNHANGQQQRGIKGYFDNTTASVSYARKINEKWSLALRTAYDDRSFSAQNFYTTFASDTATETVKSWWNHARLTYGTGKLKWQTSVGYKAVSDYYLYNSKSVANSNKSNILQALSTLDFLINEQTSLTTGVQFINKGITSNDRGNHTVYQAAAFAVLHQAIGKYVFIDPAIRIDYNQRGGLEFVPQLNAAFRMDKLQLRASIGRTIRDADFTERFNNYNKPLVTGGRIGNPDLEAETSVSYEAGADYRISDKLKVSGTLFQRHHQKLIDYIATPYADMPRKTNLSPTGSYALAKNFSDVKTTGWETDILFQHPFSSHHQLNASFGLTWLNSELDGGGTPGFYLSAHSKFLTNFSIIYNYKWLTLSANGVYKTRNEQKAAAINTAISKDYFVANFKADAMAGKKIGIFIQVDNIADRQYSDLLGAIMPGRWLMGGARVSF